jgi:hypothetical protein
MSTDATAGVHEELVHVFVSYAREDRRWLDANYQFNLVPFLVESLRRHNVVFWFDTELKPGDEFKRNIDAEIDQAQIALLIVSQHFLNSEFIESREMPRIAARAQRGQMIVIPVLVEPCDWTDYPFLSDRQMVPSSPLIEYTVSEPSWAKVKYQILDGLKAQLKRIREPGQMPVVETRRSEGPANFDPMTGAPIWPQAGPAGVAPGPYDTGRIPRVDTPPAFVAPQPGQWPPPGALVVPTRSKIPPWALGLGLSALVVIGIYAAIYSYSHRQPVLPASTPSTTGGETGGTNPSSSTSSIMQPYTSSGGRFNVLFPGTPKEQTEQVKLPEGQTATLFQIWVSLENDNIAYTVMYNDYPDEYGKVDPQKILEGARDGATKGRTLMDDEVISLNGIPGRAITATGSDGYNYAAHLYLDGVRLYQVVVISSKDHPATYTEEFMNSFRVF